MCAEADISASPRSQADCGGVFPNSSVGLVEYSLPDGTHKTCTGFLVADRIVMTAAHCVLPVPGIAHQDDWAQVERFTPHYEPGTPGASGPFKVVDRYASKEWANCPGSGIACEGYDKGWIVLDRPTGLPYLKLAEIPSSASFERLEMLGYPDDATECGLLFATSDQWLIPPPDESDLREVDKEWGSFFSPLRVADTQSGAPVWSGVVGFEAAVFAIAVGTTAQGSTGGEPYTVLTRIVSGDNWAVEQIMRDLVNFPNPASE